MTRETTYLKLPDTTVQLPELGLHASPEAVRAAEFRLQQPVGKLFARLINDRESPASLVLARLVLEAFLPEPGTDGGVEEALAEIETVRQRLQADAEALAAEPDAEVRAVVLSHRAPLALIHGSWLEVVSQPATQPAVIVNRLLGQHFQLQGQGNPQSQVGHVWRRILENEGVFLPETAAEDFLRRAGERDLTAAHGAFLLALSRLPATFLPEVVGVHVAMSLLGLDATLLRTSRPLEDQRVRDLLHEYGQLAQGQPEALARMRTAVRLVLRLEAEHLQFLMELAQRRREMTVDDRAYEVFARHAPYAGRQHGSVVIAGRKISEWLSEGDLDVAGFMSEFKTSRPVRRRKDGSSRFLGALRFGGPMFGIFDESESRVLSDWVEAAQTDPEAPLRLTPDTAGQATGQHWVQALRAVEAASVPDLRVSEPDQPGDHRELLFRLVNVENFPHALELARAQAEVGFEQGQVLWRHGAGARYTDASWFEYSREALLQRVETIYWDKLVNPYRPLTELPGREEVLFYQRSVGLGGLIDGAWAHRIGQLGRYRDPADGMLYSIYADEMGRGEEQKNHVQLIVQVLASMGIHLPRLREAAFREQDELPDSSYGFTLHQLSMALLPDRYFNEILGYNLGIEMFGLGELRLHEMQRLRHHGFDVAYEEAHLSIDNFSAGHARQAAEIVIAHLDGVQRRSGETAVQEEWRRIWRGYSSFAYFVEHPFIAGLPQGETEEPACDNVLI